MGDFKDSNVTTGAVANRDCDGCNPKVIQEIGNKYKVIISKNPKHFGSKMLKHWMQGTGIPIYWDVDILRKDGWIESEGAWFDNNVLYIENKQREKYIEAIKKYFINRPSMFWEDKYLYSKDGDYPSFFNRHYRAYGAFVISSRGIFKYKKTKNTFNINATIEYVWHDKYDWNPNGWAIISNLLYGVDDDMALLYEKCANAKPFEMFSIWHQTLEVSFTINELKGEEKNKILDKVIWGKIEKGKAPVADIGVYEDWRNYNHKALTEGGQDEELLLESLIKDGLSEDEIRAQGVETDLTYYELPFFKDKLADETYILFSELD